MSVQLEGKELRIPKVNGNPEVFTNFRFFFAKPTWQPDESCNECFICRQGFTTLRRKHHCRNCGRVLCSKCCIHKVALPQYALDEPQRTCNSCVDVADLVGKSRSQFISHRQAAAVGLVNMLKTPEGLYKMVSCGGIQTILSMTSQGDSVIWESVASASHILAQHFTLHDILISSGTLHAVSYLMDTTNDSNQNLLVECLTTLSLLCSNKLFKNKVLDLMDICLVEDLLFSQYRTVQLLSARVLLLLVKDLDLLNIILQKSCSLISNVLKALKTDSIQMQDQVLKILICLSAGSENIKHQIIQEDAGGTGHFLFPFLKGLSAEKSHLLQNALCLLGNLACSPAKSDNGYLQVYITPVLELLNSNVGLPAVTLMHISRTIANLAEFPVNALPLVNNLPQIVNTLLISHNEGIRLHACRIIITLMASESSATLQSLSENGADDFLGALFGIPGMTDILTGSILKNVSKLSMDIP